MRALSSAAAVVAFGSALFVAPVSAVFSAETAPLSRDALVRDYCAGCHNNDLKIGNFSLADLDLGDPSKHSEQVEKILLKLRSGMMPPEGMPRPEREEIMDFVAGLELELDQQAKTNPDPGRPVLHRLNRFEYKNVIRELFDLDIETSRLLPPDDMTMGYDNMSDVLTVSPTLLDSYMGAASTIARLAVGDPAATPVVETYVVPVTYSQLRHVEGTPFGTRGGMAFVHNFPADGDYVIRASLYFRSLGPLFGDNKPGAGDKLEVAIDGERVALFDINRKMKVTEDLRTERVRITTGPHRISASFLLRHEGPVQDFVMPFEQATADLTTGNVQGLTGRPHLRNVGVDGPYDVTGISETPSRKKIFVCRPEPEANAEAERLCAEDVIEVLARRAFRRPTTADDTEDLIAFFEQGRAEGDFDSGIRTAVQRILSDPEFLFRFERTPEGVRAGDNYRVSDLELASRLSFFLWSTAPDEELLGVAESGRLSEPKVLEAQTRRMLDDPRSMTLSTKFASHWLHLQNLQEVHPDVFHYYDWDQNLTRSMRKETELFFDSIVRDDQSILSLLNADYTFMDRRLAAHYGVPGILGNRFRRVAITDENRRGILGHASILTLTSVANRTSPVIRGAWILDVLMGTPPPTPPADVPPLDENEGGGELATVRERLEQHRANPACASCHNIMDPLGYALENFDAIGAWRIKDAGIEVDPSGTLFDGTDIGGPAGLRKFLLANETLVVRNFTRNFLMYGLGRVLRPQDMSTVRSIVSDAKSQDYRFSSFVLGVVNSTPFQMRRAEATMVSTEEASN